MHSFFNLPGFLLFANAVTASCSAASDVDSQAVDFGIETHIETIATFNEPWAAAFVPGTEIYVVTERNGHAKAIDTKSGEIFIVKGLPSVDYQGQGGLGDIAFLEQETWDDLTIPRVVYLTWAEAGFEDTRGAALGMGKFRCVESECFVSELRVIWRQSPKVEGNGHYSHRVRISPEGNYIFIASGDRRATNLVQDRNSSIGSIIRLNLDGSPAEGNPFSGSMNTISSQIWTYGHRNILGMAWDADQRLWAVEHGPAGGDELNLIKAGQNYGWPIRSYGKQYNGTPITDHSPDDGFEQPSLHWTPVIAPSDMIFYRGQMFDEWQNDALITGLSSSALVRVRIDRERAVEQARYDFPGRLRSVDEASDGSIWVLEDGPEARLIKISRKTL